MAWPGATPARRNAGRARVARLVTLRIWASAGEMIPGNGNMAVACDTVCPVAARRRVRYGRRPAWTGRERGGTGRTRSDTASQVQAAGGACTAPASRASWTVRLVSFRVSTLHPPGA
jgi:hypothetical protein